MRRPAHMPRWEVYDRQGEHRASVHYIEDCAILVAAIGEGTTIRDGHDYTVWTEGTDGRAHESYDNVANVVYKKVGTPVPL